MIVSISSEFIVRKSLTLVRRGSCAALGWVKAGVACLSPTRCGQAAWSLRRRAGTRCGGIVRRHRGAAHQLSIPGWGGQGARLRFARGRDAVVLNAPCAK